MSDQPNQEAQPNLTPEQLRQSLLDQLSTSKKVIQELTDEDLMDVAGGVGVMSWAMRAGDVATLSAAFGGTELLTKASIKLGL